MPHSTMRVELIADYFALRKQVFVEQMGWQLSAYDRYESEEYDNPIYPHYVIAQKKGRVIAGARLLRCDTQIKQNGVTYSYMIRDAAKGLIDLPPNLIDEEPPVDAQSWELTRLVSIDPDPTVSQSIMDISYQYMKRLGARQVLLLARPSIMRFVRKSGYEPKAIGPIVRNESGSFLAFKCDINLERR